MEEEDLQQKLADFYYVLSVQLRVKIVEGLYIGNKNKPKSFSEIQNFLEESFGKKYPSSAILFHLRGLEKKGIIKNERKLDLSTGRARTSFYYLTEKGEWMAETLIKIREVIKDILKHGS